MSAADPSTQSRRVAHDHLDDRAHAPALVAEPGADGVVQLELGRGV